MRASHELVAMTIVLSASLLAGGCGGAGGRVERAPLSSATPFGEVYALWVTRWDYRTKEDVETIVRNAADLGITDLVFQVRGQADAFYKSAFEPWGEELLADLGPGATDPGFDPLKLACELAHQRRMRLHAWINVMPLWKGKSPPRNQKHLYHTRMDFRLYDIKGEPQPLNDHYVIVNPLNPQVHEHINRVVADIVGKYPVDGIHMDYIRFVSELMDQEAGYPAGARVYQAFKDATGRDARTDPQAYRQWIMTRITDLVRGIRETIESKRPGTVLSAAVWRDYQVGKETYLQDYPKWIEEGLIDAAMPMIYTTDDALFESNARDAIAIRGAAALLPGVGAYQHSDPAQTLRQFEIARKLGASGVCVFSYHALFDSASHEQTKDEAGRALRERMRQAVRSYIRQGITSAN